MYVVQKLCSPVLLWAGAVCLVALAWTTTHPVTPRGASSVVTWLRTRAAEGDDAVIAYGQPQILQGAGLQSPYPDIWSLPVRVHDPGLRAFATLLSGDRAPDFVVLTNESLDTWGVDPTAGTRALDEGYVVADVVDGYTIYRRQPSRTP